MKLSNLTVYVLAILYNCGLDYFKRNFAEKSWKDPNFPRRHGNSGGERVNQRN